MKINVLIFVILILNLNIQANELNLSGSFKSYTYPSNSQINLMDIVHLKNLNEKNRILFNTIKINTYKYKEKITSLEVIKLLPFENIKWKGRKYIQESQYSTKDISASELSKTATNCALTKLKSLGLDFSLTQITRMTKKIIATPQNYEIKCSFVKNISFNNVPARMPVTIHIIDNNKTISSSTYWFKITVVKNVYVTLGKILNNQKIDLTNTKLIPKSFSGYSQSLDKIQKLISSGALEAKNNIEANELITDKISRIRPEVRKNEKAKLVFDSNDIKISFNVIPQENGYLNERIMVLIPSSHESISAKVTGKGALTIE